MSEDIEEIFSVLEKCFETFEMDVDNLLTPSKSTKRDKISKMTAGDVVNENQEPYVVIW